jgi:two-component system chemotaxis sensor kinase CheA
LSKGAAKVFEALKNGGPFSKNAGKTAALADLIRGMREEAGIGDQKRIADEIADIFAVFSSADSGIDELAISTMSDKLNELRKKPEGPDSGTDGNKPSPPPVGKMPEVSGAKHEKTMRIPEQSLDDFLRCVGDLLSVEEQLRHVSRQIGAGNDVFLLSDNLKDAIRQFESISKELRSKIMDVRKVEARVLLQKAGRIVRDISSQSGKKISVECIGEDLRIDKSYIDLLDAPLTHMLRNAADHGIELPQTRSAAGKPETGTISVTLKENDDDLTFVVSDDGAGLDYEGLRKKAVGLGIVADTAQLSKSDIVELLFRSGITTAAVVTDVSGRGVGMDVVKRAIVEAGGRIDVSSTPGSGTAFTVSLPRNASTQIIDGYVVQSFSEESYVLPLGFVLEAFDFLPGDVSGVAGGRALMRRGSVYPLHDIDSLLGDRADRRCETADGCRKGVLLDVKGAKTVISVKEIIGIQKVVCKPVEGDLVEETIFDGAAISGTGKVFMIVNPEKLLKSG